MTILQCPVFNLSQSSATADIGDDDPFSGDINFGVFVNATDGKLFYNRNDINTEIKRSQELGSEYYTLTYQPTAGNADGKFRRILSTLRDPNLPAMTKTGYFAPDKAFEAPLSWEEHTSMMPRPAAKVRTLRFKNLPPFRHDRGLQIPRLRYSPGLVPTTRLNALLNAASDS
jgi:hypothetical protein